MKWHDKYNTGIELVDSQHKELFRIIERLQSTVASKQENVEIANALKFLVDYTQSHFTAEEDLMNEKGYPELETHKVLHRELIKQVVELLMKLKQKKAVTGTNLVEFLVDWLINHILDEDKKIGEFASQKDNVDPEPISPADPEKLPDIKERIKKLNALLTKKLITDSDFIAKKSVLLKDYCRIDNPSDKNVIDEKWRALKFLAKKGLISEDELQKHGGLLFEQVNLSQLLKTIPEIEDQFLYLSNLNRDKLISDEIHQRLKSEILSEL